jgi:hypothetical protein
MIPSSDLFDQSVVTQLLDHVPSSKTIVHFSLCLIGAAVEQWQAQRSSRGRPAHPESTYLKAFL